MKNILVPRKKRVTKWNNLNLSSGSLDNLIAKISVFKLKIVLAMISKKKFYSFNFIIRSGLSVITKRNFSISHLKIHTNWHVWRDVLKAYRGKTIERIHSNRGSKSSKVNYVGNDFKITRQIQTSQLIEEVRIRQKISALEKCCFMLYTRRKMTTRQHGYNFAIYFSIQKNGPPKYRSDLHSVKHTRKPIKLLQTVKL